MGIRIIKSILAIMCLVCLLDMPYGYYELFRYFAMGSFVYFAINEKDNQGWMFVWIISALLVQPFFKASLGEEIWNIVDVGWAILLIVSIVMKNKEVTSKEHSPNRNTEDDDGDIAKNYNDYESQDIRELRDKLIDNKDSEVLWIATRHYWNCFFQTVNKIEGEILKDSEKTQYLMDKGTVSRGNYPLSDFPDKKKPIYVGSVYETNEYYEPYDVFLEYIDEYIESVKSQDKFSGVDFFLQSFIVWYEESVDDEFNYDSYHETKYSSQDIEILDHKFGNGGFKVLNDINWYKDETWKDPGSESWSYKVLIK